jgi:hypothetical protein
MTTYLLFLMGLLTIMFVFPLTEETENDLSYRPYRIVWFAIGATAGLMILSLWFNGGIHG